MFSKIKEFFTGKKPEAAPEAPYKVDAAPAGTETPVTAGSWPFPTVEAVVVVPDAVVPDAVVPMAVVEQAPAKREPAKRGPAKPKAPVAKPAAVKKPRAPKAV